MKLYFFQTTKLLQLNSKYILYALAYGLSSLIIPLAVQFLVNNLALSGIWVNLVTFLAVISFGLVVSQIIKYSQTIIVEFLQREIFVGESKVWERKIKQGYSHYYFETFNLLKSFSKSYVNLIEMFLVSVFGFITLILFHPVFIILVVLFVAFIHRIIKETPVALRTSIKESDEKYLLYNVLIESGKLNSDLSLEYLGAREKHFQSIKKIAFKVSLLSVLSQVFILGVGIYLIQIKQLSVGQLVSAEIIISGILATFAKLPQSMESFFDYETSRYKINKAVGQGHDE